MAKAASLLIVFLSLNPARAFENSAQTTPRRFATESVPQPRFADPDRGRKLAAAFPEIERLFTTWAERRHIPGAVMGILIDGEMVWVKATGVQALDSRAPVTPDTVFRIASMTKSCTAMAILKLRDEGKLSLDDPAARYVPELADLPYPTKDSQELTIRHLLTHSEGFPVDDSWGDRQLAQSDETMRSWLRAGIPFSNPPGVTYEYSNYGFAILGQVIARASGKPYADYVRAQILEPLGLRASTFEAAEVPRDRMAFGYLWKDDIWKDEPALAHGSFAPMAGLWMSARDLARYVAFLMAAYPPRNEPETGPIRRSSAREMQQAWRVLPASAYRSAVDAPLQMSAPAYGFGLAVVQDCRFGSVVGHPGGLPGYGSLMRWLPEHGVGLIAMGNVTYASFGGLFNDTWAALQRTGALQPRSAEPSPALRSAQEDVSHLITRWDDALAARIVADNFFLDESAERRAAQFRELNAKHGACRPATAIQAGSALRGKWRMSCERGWIDVAVALAPTMPPRVQSLDAKSIFPPDEKMNKTVSSVLQLMGHWDGAAAESIAAPGFDVERMRRQAAAASSWGACKMDDVIEGDGSRESAVRLSCDRGTLVAHLSLDPDTNRLKSLNLVPPRDQRCVP